MGKRILACFITLACAFSCFFALTACGSSDANDIVGEWKIKNTDVTVVFSGNEFKLVGNSFDYTIDPGTKTITYKSGDATGTAKYTLSSDNQVLTLEENDGTGSTKVTEFERVSNDGNALPSAGGVVD